MQFKLTRKEIIAAAQKAWNIANEKVYKSTIKPRPEPFIQVGDLWFVKFNDAKSLLCVEIVDVTPCTVLLREKLPSDKTVEMRYDKADIKFIEKLIYN